jgi:hypothetical protein
MKKKKKPKKIGSLMTSKFRIYNIQKKKRIKYVSKYKPGPLFISLANALAFAIFQCNIWIMFPDNNILTNIKFIKFTFGLKSLYHINHSRIFSKNYKTYLICYWESQKIYNN